MKIDTGSTAWMLASTALVLLMTPGLAFFYGGMTRAKTALNMMMMSWVAIITVTIAWVLYGDSLTFGKGNWFIGGFEYLGEHGLVTDASRVDGHPRPRVLRLPAHLRRHHRRADQRRDRRPDQVRRLGGVHRRLGDAGVLPGRPLGVGRRLAQQPGDRGLRRRHGRPRQRRLRGPRARDRPRQAARLGQGPDAAAQPPAGAARRGTAVVRLVRLQRGLRAGGGRDRRPGVHEHPDRDRGRGRRLAAGGAVP